MEDVSSVERGVWSVPANENCGILTSMCWQEILSTSTSLDILSSFLTHSKQSTICCLNVQWSVLTDQGSLWLLCEWCQPIVLAFLLQVMSYGKQWQADRRLSQRDSAKQGYRNITILIESILCCCSETYQSTPKNFLIIFGCKSSGQIRPRIKLSIH